MGTGHHAALAAKAGPGKIAAVVGDGAVGLCGVIAARRLGAERIILLGRHDDRVADTRSGPLPPLRGILRREPVAKSPVGLLWRFVLVGTCLIPYGVAYAVPALRFHLLSGEDKIMRGYELAMLGALALLEFNVAWFANLLYLPSLALMLARLWRPAAVLAALAAVFGLHTLQLYGRTIDVSLNMGHGNPMLLARLEPGFYFWMASFGLVVVVSLACWLRDPKLEARPAPSPDR